MSSSHEVHKSHEVHEGHSLLDQYWWVLLILFGISCVLFVALFHPPAWW